MCQEVIDVKDVLERVQDDQELFLELLDIFEGDFVEKRVSFSRFIEQENYEEIKDLVHSIKGATGNISAKAMHASCIKIEQLAEAKDLEALKQAIIVLDQQFIDLQARSKEIKQEFTEK